MDGGELREDLRRCFRGVEFFGDAGELNLVGLHVDGVEGEQAVERCVDHLVVEQLFAIGFGTEA